MYLIFRSDLQSKLIDGHNSVRGQATISDPVKGPLLNGRRKINIPTKHDKSSMSRKRIFSNLNFVLTSASKVTPGGGGGGGIFKPVTLDVVFLQKIKKKHFQSKMTEKFI